MAYTRTVWVDGSDPAITAAQLNRIEKGVEDAHEGSINPGAIGTAELANGSVTTGKLADGAVTRDKIAGGAVFTNQLADIAVTTDKIRDQAVRTEKLRVGSVDTPRLANGAVTTTKIFNGAVTSAKLASTNNERAWILALLATLTTPDVMGGLAFLRKAGSANSLVGSTHAGSDLRYSDSTGTLAGGAPSGTWRCLGHAVTNAATLWMRIT